MSNLRASNQLADGTALVTGGAGYIGSHVTAGLVRRGWAVRVLERPDAVIDHLPKGVEVQRGDIRSGDDARRAVAGCDVIFHLAANPNLWARDPNEFETVNHQGTRRMLEAASEAGARRFIHVSTESILTSPKSREVINERTPLRLNHAVGPYCRSKMRAELAAMEFAQRGLPVIIASPTVPVGPGDWKYGPLTRLISQSVQGKVRGYLDAQINIVDVRDVAEGIIAAALRGRVGQRYLLAGENWTIPELFGAFSRITGVPVPRWRVPYPLALSFAWLEEHYCRWRPGRMPMATLTGVRLARRPQIFDASSTIAELQLQFRPCIDALRQQVAWLAGGEAVRGRRATQMAHA